MRFIVLVLLVLVACSQEAPKQEECIDMERGGTYPCPVEEGE